MRKLVAIGLILVAVLVSSAAMGEVELFKGLPTGYKVGGWGSGFCTLAADRPLVGSAVIKITTQGLHEGGRLDFDNPVEIVSDSVDSEYLQFSVRFTTVSVASTTAFYGPGFGVTSMPGLMNPKMAAYYYQDMEVPARAKVSTFRVVMLSADGKKSVEASSSVPMKSEDGWYKISIPMKIMGFKKGDSFPVKRMMFFSDVPDNYSIGEISVVKDDTPITATPCEDQVIGQNDIVLFRADAEGGATQLHYSWNFGDVSALGEDATGEITTHRFKRGGDFKVKLTVSDVWGIKSPVTVETLITVND